MKEFKKILIIAVMLFVSGCMGRDPVPVQIYLKGDENRSCIQLFSEIEQNEILIKEKLKKDKSKFWSNAAWILISPLAMDTKEAEKEEAKALQKRNVALKVIMKEKNCE